MILVFPKGISPLPLLCPMFSTPSVYGSRCCQQLILLITVSPSHFHIILVISSIRFSFTAFHSPLLILLFSFTASHSPPLLRFSFNEQSMTFDVTPSRSSSVSTESSSVTVPSSSSEFTVDVLRVINKIMEGSARSQEQLTMMGERSYCFRSSLIYLYLLLFFIFHFFTFHPLTLLSQGSSQASSGCLRSHPEP